jgi:hypothetical protein
MMGFNGDRIETYFTFDNIKGEYYCHVEIDEYIVSTKEWAEGC